MAIVAAPKTALAYGAGILYWAAPGAPAPSTAAGPAAAAH